VNLTSISTPLDIFLLRKRDNLYPVLKNCSSYLSRSQQFSQPKNLTLLIRIHVRSTVSYVARTLLSWSRVMFETRPTR